ncbi:MAG: nucleolar RNA-binding Nop10p family protein [Candidatus Bilamarchaeum sp.]
MKKMMFCPVCESYTLSDTHCSKHTISAHPPRFNPNDWYGAYRRSSKYEVTLN